MASPLRNVKSKTSAGPACSVHLSTMMSTADVAKGDAGFLFAAHGEALAQIDRRQPAVDFSFAHRIRAGRQLFKVYKAAFCASHTAGKRQFAFLTCSAKTSICQPLIGASFSSSARR